MSSDGYFDGEDGFDSDAFAQIDAIEAAHQKQGQETKQPALPTKQDSFDEFSFNMDENELNRLDLMIKDAYEGNKAPVAGPSKFKRTPSTNMVQTTLFGGVAATTNAPNTNKPRSQIQRTTSTQRNLFGQQAPKTKKWDQTAFAKSGVKQAQPKDKGKQKAGDDDWDDEPVEFEQFPAPFVSLGPPPPMKLIPDLLEVKHWIYPINKPKRDYQYNIVKHCLFDNTLVALPTGLGKTFIAGVVMLNFYRWFPEGKVVFVAPTKPLVAQQVAACHETCGIPGKDSIELTGEVPRTTRIKAWSEKRVFFMTPQTLVNDLVKETCDVRDIILLVVDEAHRATGNYAYNQAIRYLMAKNRHFRVLALTATPGNDPKGVQTLIDGLHISRIEIRNEESLDLKPYIHKKTFVPHIIKASTTVRKIRDLLVNVMSPLMKPLLQAGLLYPSESAVSMHPYRPQALQQEQRAKRFRWPLTMLAQLARAMLYLLTGSIEACYQFLCDMTTDPEPVEGDEQQKAKGRKLKDDPNFRILMQELERQKATGFERHPKMEALLNILIQHFGRQEEGTEETRVIVFSSYRAVVDQIVEELGKHQPLLKAARFIGQGTDKHGKKGLAQKEQQEVIGKFQAGKYNILVATCIGEEGLDIGEIDVTICYDADKTPTRMIQRFGRTGRKRDGTIHALLSEEREEFNIEKAEAAYREVQKQINKGEQYELYGDVERLVPQHMKPECIEKVVEIQEYARDVKTSPRKKAAAALGLKRKRNDNIMRNIPEGASTGFVSVRDLITKVPSKTKKIKMSKNFEADGKDDETDEDIESGRIMAPIARTQSAAAAGTSNTKTKEKAKLRKSSTATDSKVAKPRRKTKEALPTLTQFAKQGRDDVIDMDIEKGAILTFRSEQPNGLALQQADDDEERDLPLKRSPLKKKQSRTILSPSPEPRSHKVEPLAALIELTDSEKMALSPTSSRGSSPSPESPVNRFARQDDMGWLVDDDDDDDLRIDIVNSSPLRSKDRDLFPEKLDDPMLTSRSRLSSRSLASSTTSNTLVDESIVEIVEDLPFNPNKGKAKQLSAPSSSPEVLALKNLPTHTGSPMRQRTKHATVRSPVLDLSSSPPYPPKDLESMPPPALPKRLLPHSFPADGIPEPSYPVRPLGYQPKRRRIILDESDSPAQDEPPPPSQHRLHRMASTPVHRKDKKETKRNKPTLLGRKVNPVFDGEAAHSGDEVSEGESNSEDDVESESDRQFIKDSPLTQLNLSYEQTQIYRRSLMTQVENEGTGPAFARAPARQRPFGRIDGPRMTYGSRRRGGLPSSSPPLPDEELDNYEFGSFVVADDDVSYIIDD